MKDSVYTLKYYGKTTIHLKQIIDKKKISRNKLCNMIATIMT